MAITVTVSGPIGCGKTVVAGLINEMLTERGYFVSTEEALPDSGKLASC